MDMAVGDDGMVYVLNRIMCGDGLQPLGQIARLLWDDDGSWDLNERTPLGGVGTDDGQFIWPVCMIIDAAQVLFVSDEALHRITSLTTQGEFVNKWGEHGDGDGQLDRPSGIAFDAEENILVADTMNHRVQRFTKDGKFLTKWGSYGTETGSSICRGASPWTS